ncbi:hypothetical protein [Zavarzinia sp.]|uniref:hypothetical protein n=1 Tax=Zavarzinia sp. TaxID=2027920 RepID=UPI003566ACC6
MAIFRATGWDVSPTHGAAVALGADGRILDFTFLAEAPAAVKTAAGKRYGSHLPQLARSAIPDQEVRDLRRLVPTMRLFLQWRKRLAGVGGDRCYGAIEAYAFGAGKGAHTKGEIGGLVRLVLMQGGWWLRTHDPTSVKIYATGRGDAEKGDVADGVARKWGPAVIDQLSGFDSVKAKNKPVLEDLIDAYVLARMCLREIQLRSGEVSIRDLPEEEIRVFNRATKALPVNALGREWIHEPADPIFRAQ